MWKGLRLQLMIGMGLGAAVMLGLAAFGDAGEVAKGLARANPASIAAACALSLANYSFRFVKWHYYLKCLGLPVSPRLSYMTFMSGLSMSVTPGKLGELLKAFMLKAACGIPVSVTTPVVIAERATDASGLLLLAALGTMAFPYGKAVLVAFAAFFLAGLVLVRQRRLVTALLGRLESLPVIGHRLGSKVPVLLAFYESSYSLFLPSRLLLTTLMSAASWALEGFAFHVILSGLGLGLGLWKTVFIFSFSSLVGAVSMLPGGLGAADGSLVGLLAHEGIKRGPASLAALLIRLCTLWLAVAVGLVFLGVSAKTGLAAEEAKVEA